jgi:uncharacterized membrane protein
VPKEGDISSDREFLERLASEISLWEREGEISPDQAEALRKRYAVTEKELAKSRKEKLIRILSTVGAVSIGVGVILFFASNWQYIPRPFKLTLIFAAIFAAYGSGYYLTYYKSTQVLVGKALILLGAILFGSGIWLIAQMFHISAHWQTGILIWALGVLPLAYTLGSATLIVFCTGLLTFWGCAEMGESEKPFLLLPVILCAAALPLAYLKKSSITISCVIWAICIWWLFAISTTAYYREPFYPSTFVGYLILGVALYAIGSAHSYFEPTAQYKLTYQRKGVIAALIASFILSFPDFLREFHYYWSEQSKGGERRLLLFLFIGCAVAVAVAAVLGMRKGLRRRTMHGELGALIVLTLFPLLWIFYRGNLYEEKGWLYAYAVAFNIILFGSAIGVILVGYLNRHRSYLYIGSFFIAIGILARYFDAFFRFLPKSLFFVGGGVILLAISIILGRKMRKIAQSMESEREGD